MRKLGIETIKEYVEIPDIPTIKEVREIYDDALYMYQKGEVSEVKIVYTEFKSAITCTTLPILLAIVIPPYYF